MLGEFAITTLAAGGAGEGALALLLIAVLGVGAQFLAWRVGLPSILLLLAFGFAVGPGAALTLGQPILDPDPLFGDLLFPLVGLCVGLILYEGGLTLRAREIKGVSRVVFMLVSVGALVTWGIAALGAYFLLDLSLELSLLLGAILIVTGPTVVGPLLQHIRPSGQSGPVLRWEGIVIDPIGAVAAVLVLETLLAGNPAEAPVEVILALVRTVVVGGGLGLLSAGVLVVFLDRYWIPEQLQNPVSLMLAVASYTVSNMLQAESGLLATTVMGVALANQRRVDVRHILEFKENLRTLIIASLFIVLGARITPDDLRMVDWSRAAGFLAVLVLIARPVSVWISTIGAGLSLKERLFMSWMAPRGIVAASVSSVFALSLAEARPESQATILVPLTFSVIVGTVCVYGLTASFVARALGVSDQDPQGLLVIGASPVARSISAVLKRHGVTVHLVDTNRGNVTAARMANLGVSYGNVLEDLFFEELDLRGVGRVIAMTPNDEVNTLALQRFEHRLGKANLYRLPARPEKKEKAKTKTAPAETTPAKSAPARTGPAPSPSVDADPGRSATVTTGRRLFNSSIDLSLLEKRLASGWVIKATSISAEFTMQEYHTLYGDEAVPMFAISGEGDVQIAVAGKAMTAEPGSKVIALVNPESLFMFAPMGSDSSTGA
jgi:NhaP-type Na+/H+ or K+/H+ antiporter